MTIPEAIDAARKCSPVVYTDPMLGDMMYGRIGAIKKVFNAPHLVARGRAPESYSLELLPMSEKVQSVMDVDPARVRVAEAADLANYKLYKAECAKMPGYAGERSRK